MTARPVPSCILQGELPTATPLGTQLMVPIEHSEVGRFRQPPNRPVLAAFRDLCGEHDTIL